METGLQKKGVLFDFDGVTVKSMEQHYEGWRRAFAEKGIELKKEDFFPLEGQGIYEISKAIGRRYDMDEDTITAVVKRKVYYYNELMTIEFYDHYLDMLRNLKKKNIEMGVVTGGSRERVIPIFDEYLADYFSAVVTVDDVQKGKPHPDPYLKGADLLKLSADECLVVENAPLGIKSALAAGMTVIGITTTVSKEILKDAHYIVNDFFEVEKLILELSAKTM
jgi:beta-phosphoglucomutase